MAPDEPYFINRKKAEADSRLAELLRQAVDQVIVERIIPAVPMYFAPRSDALVTYDWFIFERNAANHRIEQLEQQVAYLSKPWWRRWLHR